MKNIYIFGSNGQDGLLLSKQITIKFPIATQVLFSKKKIKVLNNLKIETYFFRDFLEYLNLIEEFFKKYPPDQIYYLAAVHYSSQEAISNIKDDQSMVFTNYFLPIHLINEIYRLKLECSFLFASSSLIFSGSNESPQNESTERFPLCNYSKQKNLTEMFINNLNKSKSISIKTAILYNHESVHRKNKFFTKKIISFCSELAKSKISKENITLYNPESIVDMGYANEYVKGMIELSSKNLSGSFLFATGKPIKIKEFVEKVLDFYKLPSDIVIFKNVNPRNNIDLIGDSSKLKSSINWNPIYYGEKLVYKLCQDFEDNL